MEISCTRGALSADAEVSESAMDFNYPSHFLFFHRDTAGAKGAAGREQRELADQNASRVGV
jgi:hypothetical protein